MIQRLLFTDRELLDPSSCCQTDLFRNKNYDTIVCRSNIEEGHSYEHYTSKEPANNWRECIVEWDSGQVIRFLTEKECIPFLVQHEFDNEETVIVRNDEVMVSFGPEIPWEIRVPMAKQVAEELNKKRDKL